MLTWTVVLFAAAAVGGATMLLMRSRERPVPMGLALAHGGLAAVALVLLAFGVVGGAAAGLATVALVVFVAAALGGFVLFASHLRTGTFSLRLGLVHGLTAAVAFVLLLVELYF